jgi:hypothetical protein
MYVLLHMLEAKHRATCPLCQKPPPTRSRKRRRRWLSLARNPRSEDDGGVAVTKDAVLAVPGDGACEHRPLDVGA